MGEKGIYNFVTYSDGRTDEFYGKCTPDNQVLTPLLEHINARSFVPKDGTSQN